MEILKSWAGNMVWRPKAVHQPRDEQEIAELVTHVAEEGGRLKPVGSGLSWSDINEVEYAIPLEMMCPDDDDKKNFERFNGGINRLDGTFRF